METISLILGTFVITSGLLYSDGPWGILYKLRANSFIKDFGAFECFLCISLYVSIVLCMVFNRFDLVLISWGSSVIIDALIQAYRAK